MYSYKSMGGKILLIFSCLVLVSFIFTVNQLLECKSKTIELEGRYWLLKDYINSKRPYGKMILRTVNSPGMFMVETSGGNCIKARQSCAIESAAIHNLNTTVILVFTGNSSYTSITNCSYFRVLSTLPNFRLYPVTFEEFFRDSPLEKWYKSNIWKGGPYVVSHMSDAFRFLLVWKYGGGYVDLDVVFLKSIENLRNTIGRESSLAVASGAFVFERKHFFLSLCLRDFTYNYKPEVWAHNGPGVVERALRRLCPGMKLDSPKDIKCYDTTVLTVD